MLISMHLRNAENNPADRQESADASTVGAERLGLLSRSGAMIPITLVGSGQIGAMVADFLARCGDYAVTVVDRSAAALARLDTAAPVARRELDVRAPGALAAALQGQAAVLNAAPFHLTADIARAAAEAGVHYLDLTEDVASTRQVRELAAGARGAFVPQCGLAPGFITIVAADLIRRFERLRDVRLRVGALPKFPSNALGYNLTWSTEGLINEYCEPCEAIVNGQRSQVPALEDCESFALDGVSYEAFNTSGGLGSLCETLEGRVRNLNYRSIRYPGHAALMKALLDDLRLRERRDLLRDILEHAVPATRQDVVIIFVTVCGQRQGRLEQESEVRKIYGQTVADRPRSAIQITTAASLCAVLDLLMQGQLPQQGYVRQEDIALSDFLANRFGRWYDTTADQRRAA
jgi:saccharopine dehydrogenase-like NADP-dependent oxidoreductase